MKKRIWELDALRGICIIGVIIVHFVYDLVVLYRIIPWDFPEWFLIIKNWGGIIFLLLSGVCVTLGKHHIRRGLIVLGGGLVVTLATWGMYAFMNFHESMIIYFGVLHCLGICMLLWAVFRRLPWWLLLPIGLALAGLGLHINLNHIRADSPWLMPLGLHPMGPDYFPLLPHFGFFLLGTVLGKALYRKKESYLPKLDGKPVINFFQWCGRQSLWIYLLHQPILSGICMGLKMLK